ncbi:MAG TPA: Uma2 family endonuclease [Pyrinomonadaceae bacterium]|jgi:Uma2 family endonuclease|nr:Uma2 family endonuclease [Pyrinomonadaceae bacterium]
MTTQTITTYVTPDEYLATQRLSEDRAEYLDGVVYPMTGASIRHTTIAFNIGAELNIQLRGRPGRVLGMDAKVRMPDSRKFFYPDVIVVSGEPQYHDDRKDVLLNPDIIIEVLSPSTEAFDRGAKFQAYQTLESLKEYLLVAQDGPFVEQYVRGDNGEWTYKAASGLEASLKLPSVECTLKLSAVYDKVDFNS